MTLNKKKVRDRERLILKIQGAKAYLKLWDSPFPDAEENLVRAKQIAYINSLEQELDDFDKK